MRSHLKARTRLVLTGTAVIAAIGLLAGCTGGGADEENVVDQGTTNEENAESGDTVVIGFSGPAADHGWLGAINSGAQAAADSFDDVELRVAEGTNDPIAQIAAVETFVNDGVDAIVLLPTDGAALTEAAIAAMEMLLEQSGQPKAAARINKAIRTVTGTKMKSQAAGKMGYGTREVGDLVCENL